MFDAKRRDAWQQMRELRRAGWEAYSNRDGDEAAHLYRQGLKLAEYLDSGEDVVYFRFWYGVALAAANRNLEALGVLTPTLRNLDGPGRPADIHNTLSSYIDIALEIPLDLDAIREPLAYCYQYLESIGRREWRHQVLFLEARVLEEQGRFEEALIKAEHGWAEWWANYPYFTADSHLERMVAYALKLGYPDKAAMYLDIWRSNPYNEMPLYRNHSLTLWEAMYHRCRGELALATKLAERAVQHGRQFNRPDAAQTALSQIQMLMGDPGAARQTMAQVALSHCRKHPRVLLDHWLGQVRAAAGMPPADDEYGSEFPPPTAIADPSATRQAIRRARGVYPLAHAHACRWDAAFHCIWRQDELAARLARLDAIAACLEHVS